MKIAFPILGLLVVLGACYGLAFVGIIPTQKMADKNPALAKTLIGLHLVKAKKPKPAKADTTASAVISPEQEALNTQKKQLADAQAKLAKDQADFDAHKNTSAASPPASAAPTVDTGAKLNAIYAAMSPDDLTVLFTRLPDPDVIAALINLDEKKAGKVLAALPPTRAARLTRQMSHPRPVSTAVASL